MPSLSHLVTILRAGAVCSLFIVLTACSDAHIKYRGQFVHNDTAPFFVTPNGQHRGLFFKNARTGDGYIAVTSQFLPIAGGDPFLNRIPSEILGSSPQNYDTDEACDTMASSLPEITKAERTGFLVAAEGLLDRNDLFDRTRLEKSGSLGHFYIFQGASSGKIKKCFIESQPYFVISPRKWDRTKPLTVTLALANLNDDKSNVGNLIDGLATVANVAKGVANPGSIVFNASGLADVNKIGDKADALVEAYKNYYDLKLQPISFTLWRNAPDDQPDLQTSRRFVRLEYSPKGKDTKPEEVKTIGYIEVMAVTSPTVMENISSYDPSTGYPILADISADNFSTSHTIRLDDGQQVSLKGLLDSIQLKHNSLKQAKDFDRACAEFDKFLVHKFGYGRIDQIAAINVLANRVPMIRNMPELAEIRTREEVLDGVFKKSIKQQLIAEEIAKAESNLSILNQIQSYLDAECIEGHEELLNLTKLPLLDLIRKVSENSITNQNAISSLSAKVTSFQKTNSVLRLFNANFISRGSARNQSDLDRVIHNSMKLRLRASNRGSSKLPLDLQEMDVDTAYTAFQGMKATKFGCWFRPSRTQRDNYPLDGADAIAIYKDSDTSLGRNGYLVTLFNFSPNADESEYEISQIVFDQAIENYRSLFASEYDADLGLGAGNASSRCVNSGLLPDVLSL